MSTTNSGPERLKGLSPEEGLGLMAEARANQQNPEWLLGQLLEHDMKALVTETWQNLTRDYPLHIVELAVLLENGSIAYEDLESHLEWYKQGVSEELRLKAYIDGPGTVFNTFDRLQQEAPRMTAEMLPVIEMLKVMGGPGRLSFLDQMSQAQKLAVTDRQILAGLLCLSDDQLDTIADLVLAANSPARPNA